MSTAAPARVDITAITEWGLPVCGLIIQTPDEVAGTAWRTATGWTAAFYAGRGIATARHASAIDAVIAVLDSRNARRLGITTWSHWHWTDAARRASLDPRGAGVAR